ncbi:MAG: hypothetical protein PHG95_04250 [Patescibacteria group bacterium]|nr:hypothetical protein [Patescibacteria group bacterium]
MHFFRCSKFTTLSFLSVFLLCCFALPVRAETLARRLSGKILLQVESAGEAWYVNPLDSHRYYLGRPADAFVLMRSLGLGISEKNYQAFQVSGANSLRGRILLRVQAAGEAYYVNPDDSRLYYLGRPVDAFNLMRRFGLGISNQNLNQIAAAKLSVSNDINASTGAYSWHYQNQQYQLNFNLDSALYQSYAGSSKVYTYYSGQEPADLREAFYALFLQVKDNDKQTLGLLASLRAQAAVLGLNSDQTAAFVLAFIQYIPYDHAKLESGDNTPYYPFETLYLHKGVCADKTFLAVLWLRELGYGAAILDFPESNHSAAGIACPVADSLAGSGYCYVETTNYFPIGVVPPLISGGQAQSDISSFEDLFNSDRLGYLEIKQKSQGKIYQGVLDVKMEAKAIEQAKKDLDASKILLDANKLSLDAAYQSLKQQESQLLAYQANGNISAYNQLVPAYNQAVADYQAQSEVYNQDVVSYNQAVNAFNTRYRQFYQQ